MWKWKERRYFLKISILQCLNQGLHTMEFLLLLLESVCMIVIRAQTGMQQINNEEKMPRWQKNASNSFPFSISVCLAILWECSYITSSYLYMPSELEITNIIAKTRQMAVNIYTRRKWRAEKTYIPALKGLQPCFLPSFHDRIALLMASFGCFIVMTWTAA